ncbi:hypothetical protein [Kineococcus sp. SYSU DK001]|uniref:hypothetical protein n=1 Tax=Kineococcus sp. SYSU DK001 TaxID=3383122 RepID=UPI003D7CED41
MARVGVAIVFLAVVLLGEASRPREVVSGCVPLLVGTQLVLPGETRSGRAVRVVNMVLLAVAVALVVVSTAVL